MKTQNKISEKLKLSSIMLVLLVKVLSRVNKVANQHLHGKVSWKSEKCSIGLSITTNFYV